jgi:ABC-type phosphate/phosphonate transport system permease subunit
MNNELERYGFAMEAIATRFTADDAVATWESDPRDPRLTLCIFPMGQSSSIEEQVPSIRPCEACSAYRSVEIHRQIPFFFCTSVNSISHSHLAGDFTMRTPSGFEVLNEVWTDFSNALCCVHQGYHIARRCLDAARCAFFGAFVSVPVLITLTTFIDFQQDNYALNVFVGLAIVGALLGIFVAPPLYLFFTLPNQTPFCEASAPC